MSNKSKKNKKSKNTKVRKRQERLNRTKEAWAELFELLWAESDIELEPDEEIKQCKRPYPKYWLSLATADCLVFGTKGLNS